MPSDPIQTVNTSAFPIFITWARTYVLLKCGTKRKVPVPIAELQFSRFMRLS